MNNLVRALFGLLMAVSVEASQTENLCALLGTDSTNLSRLTFAEVKNIVEKTDDLKVKKEIVGTLAQTIATQLKTFATNSATTFSLPNISGCTLDKYSFCEFVRAKLASGNDILFPTNGRQMSSEDVVKLSGANLNDGLVTKFYMAMFGLIKWEGEYLKMGFDERNQGCRIFDLSLLDKKMRQTFTTNFRKIASNSVGRTLLYRLLLEIRRTNTEGYGCIDDALNVVLEEDTASFRNNARTITIEKADEENSFSYDDEGHSFIEFFASRDTETSNVVDFSTGKLIEKSRGDDNSLFHEMVHWFHSLREPKRKEQEVAVKARTSQISKIHMGDENLELWSYEEYGKFFIKMEEFRTIMGDVVEVSSKGKVIYSPKPALYGDDLSENLYRFSNGDNLRYGHNIEPNQCVPQKTMAHMQTSYAEVFEAGGYKFNKH